MGAGWRLGLTLDDVAVDPASGRLWFPSHLSDELWGHDAASGQATVLDTPWWPFAVALDQEAERWGQSVAVYRTLLPVGPGLVESMPIHFGEAGVVPAT